MDRKLYQKIIAASFALLACSLCVHAQVSSAEWRDSLNVLNQQIAKSPYNIELRLRKAAVNLQLEQWEFAVDEYSLVLRGDKDNLAALFYRAYAYTHLRRYDLSRNDYQALLMRVPTHLEARLGLAYALQQMDRCNDALEQLNLAVEQHPDSTEAYVARASLEVNMKQYEPALYDWEIVVKRCPDNLAYRLSLVDVLIRVGKREQALRQLDELERMGANPQMLREYRKKLK